MIAVPNVLATTPLPIIAIAAYYQLPKGLSTAAPEWALAIAVIIWVLLSALNHYGRLRGKNGDRRKATFTDVDRGKLDKVYELLAHRSDGGEGEGVERYLRALQEQRQTAELVEETNELLRSINAKL